MPKLDHIPHGDYCYVWGDNFTIKVCPYWFLNTDKNLSEQQRGYCSRLKLGDWMDDGTMLLWDMCKECNENTDD